MNIEIDLELKGIKESDPKLREEAYKKLLLLFTDTNTPITLRCKTHYLNKLCSDEFLFKGIFFGETDESATRSFSILVLTLILAEDIKYEIEGEFIVDHLIRYIELESDFRAKDKNLGWIHIYAHLGDLLTFLSLHKSISNESIQRVCTTLIKKLLTNHNFNFDYDEHKRLASGFFYALENHFDLKSEAIQFLFKKNKNNKNIGLILEELSKEVQKNSKHESLKSLFKPLI